MDGFNLNRIDETVQRAVDKVVANMPCKHKWKDPENIMVSTLSSYLTVQRCEYCNLLRAVHEGKEK